MKKFETPVIEVTKFEIADVLTTSIEQGNTPGAGGQYETERG